MPCLKRTTPGLTEAHEGPFRRGFLSAVLAGLSLCILVLHPGCGTNVPEVINWTGSYPITYAMVADAGPGKTTVIDQAVQLDGRGSKSYGDDNLTFSWTQLQGPEKVVIQKANSPLASFIPKVEGTYIFALRISDGLRLEEATVQIEVYKSSLSIPEATPTPSPTPAPTPTPLPKPTVIPTPVPTIVPNGVPRADAGPNLNALTGQTVHLDGRNSMDPDGDALVFSWAQNRGAVVTLSDPTSAVASFVPTEPGDYLFTLTVGDGQAADQAALEVFVSVAPTPTPTLTPSPTPTPGPTPTPTPTPEPMPTPTPTPEPTPTPA
jgi:outer membrane biosynthesis protein TonB